MSDVYDPRKQTFDEEPELDKVFFATHGVGDMGISKEEAAFANLMDPNEPTWREIRFIKNIIKGMTKVDAYINAFNKEGDEMTRSGFGHAADRLLKRPRVARKHYQMMQAVREFEDEDLFSVVTQLNEDRQLARDLGQPSAAIAATKLKASLLGLTDERKVTNNITVNLSDTQKSLLLSRIGSTFMKPVDTIEDAEYEEE